MRQKWYWRMFVTPELSADLLMILRIATSVATPPEGSTNSVVTECLIDGDQLVVFGYADGPTAQA